VRTCDDWIRVFEIFKKYGADVQYHFRHDQAFFGGPDWDDLSVADQEELRGLGWFEDEGSASIWS